MKQRLYITPGKPAHYATACGIVVVTALACFIFDDYISYHVAALLLMLAVSIIATLYEIFPVLLAAVLSALILNFFFIPPLFTLHIRTPEDLLMFLIFFVIAVVNAVFTFRIRREERKTRERAARRESLKLYNTLFNSLSHELKTPIATIIGAVDTFRENASLSDASRYELIAQIGMAGERLHRQVNNLLNMGRLESGNLKPAKDWNDVNEMLHHVAQQAYNPGSHTISVAENENLPFFRFDIGLMQEAVRNIVQNAVSYTPPGSSVKLSARQEGDLCIITIADNGPGIQNEHLARLFDKFYRIPGTAGQGTGLGLSIARGFVEAHGGAISVKNAEGGGAVFTLALTAEATYLNKLKNE